MPSVKNLSQTIFNATAQAQKLAKKAIDPIEKKLKAASKARSQAYKKLESAEKKLKKAQSKLNAKISPANKKSVASAEKAFKKLEKLAEKTLKLQEKLQDQLDTAQANVAQTLELVKLINDFKKNQQGEKASKKPAKTKKAA